jgi:actin-related protein
LNPNTAPSSSEQFHYPMPDGNFVSIPQQILYKAPEVLFQPALINSNIPSIPQAIISSLKTINSGYWADLLSHIVLSGGNLSYPGFEERLRAELDGLVPQLGPIPKPREDEKSNLAPFVEELKPLQNQLKSVMSGIKNEDTCSKCGTLVNLSDGKEFCPKCGAPMKMPEISLDLGLGKKNETPTITDECPHCHKKIKDKTSLFCPYCGKKIEALDIPEISEEFISQAPAQEFSDFYETSSSSSIVKFFIPDNLLHSTFNGASILGSLPSFLGLFITQAEFQTNPNLLYQDISQIF